MRGIRKVDAVLVEIDVLGVVAVVVASGGRGGVLLLRGGRRGGYMRVLHGG